jgi:hypothetical protein
MQPHGNIAGYIKPQGNHLFLSGTRAGLGKFIQDCLGLNETEKFGLKYLAGRPYIVKFYVTKGLKDQRLVLLENHQVHFYPSRGDRFLSGEGSSSILIASISSMT